MIRLIIVAIVLLSSSSFAQQQSPELAFMQQAIGAIQLQRNQALDTAASCQAQNNITAAEVTKLKERIAELEKAVPK